MIDENRATELLQALDQLPNAGPALRREAMELLNGLEGYDWSGIYRLEGEELILDEYVGAETEHTRIAVGTGVCGIAVAENRNQVIEDVRSLTNYLACSLETRSELVVLIYAKSGSILGQIDIDGHKVGQFDATDERLLEAMAERLAAKWN